MRDLLARPGPYRRVWESRQRHGAAEGEVRQAAVARVLADHLWDIGERSESELSLPRTMEHRLSRLFSRGRASPQLLMWLIDAFDFSETDAQLVWQAYRSTVDPSRPAVDVPSGSASEGNHRTLSLHELHCIGEDGVPIRHRTIQVLRSLVDGLAAYEYCFDTAHAQVRVLRGGTAREPLRPVGGGLQCVDIVFPRPLRRGETAALEYETVFTYREPPPREFRRGFTRPVESVELYVQFPPTRLPRRVWWATWDSFSGPPVSREAEPLLPDGSVHRFLSNVASVIVGFVWEW